MPVCPVDENGYCERHQRVHFGRLLEISQMDNEFGEKHRRFWDEKMENPSLLKRVKLYRVVPSPPVNRDCCCNRRTCGGGPH
jgi:hypothetical protein